MQHVYLQALEQNDAIESFDVLMYIFGLIYRNVHELFSLPRDTGMWCHLATSRQTDKPNYFV